MKALCWLVLLLGADLGSCSEIQVVSDATEQYKPVQLSGNTFDAFMKAVLPEETVLCEFYAHCE